MLRDRFARSGRQRVVIPRSVPWPRDLGLEALRSQNRGPSAKMQASGRQVKGKTEVFPSGDTERLHCSGRQKTEVLLTFPESMNFIANNILYDILVLGQRKGFSQCDGEYSSTKKRTVKDR